MSLLESDLVDVRPGKHPSSCRDPRCTLTYRQHLLTIHIGADATPTRNPEVAQTNIREKRWRRDIDAYRRLYKEGFRPPHVDGARHRERHATSPEDIEHRPVRIDYNDPT